MASRAAEAGPPGAPEGKARRLTARSAAKPAVAVALAVLLALWALSAASMGSASRNSAYDETARGLSQLASSLQGEGIATQSLATGPHAIDAAEQPQRSVLLVAGVERSYTPGEVEAIRGFVERGGIAFIADDFGFGDAVGQPFGITFDKRQLRDAN